MLVCGISCCYNDLIFFPFFLQKEVRDVTGFRVLVTETLTIVELGDGSLNYSTPAIYDGGSSSSTQSIRCYSSDLELYLL